MRVTSVRVPSGETSTPDRQDTTKGLLKRTTMTF